MSSTSSSTLRPSVRYSQNFLKDARLVASLLNTSDIARDAVVYEIGPGEGIITEQLARRYRKVIAVEKDTRLAIQLQRQFADRPNVTIHAGDFLRYRLPRQPYSVFANIPFNITSAIVTKLTSAPTPPDLAYLAMQREAAAMFRGQPRATLRATLLYPWFEVEIVHRFKRADFTPAPRVDVVLLRLRKRGPPLITRADRQRFRDFVTYSFTAWQPTLGDTFSSIFTGRQLTAMRRDLDSDLDVPPTSLTCERWLSLFGYVKATGNDRVWRVIAGSERHLRQRQASLQKVHRTRTNEW